ncbi:MAG: aldo/keto reductase [Phycisphaerae bacterium]|nr:aldo/keto reductase [Phycisphaerae bacterium]NIP55762.1 aldo/keto reductase [Phycisphaerae bacterium]NIS54410.1 aldo/keto reductase [Phycisphaerae bacterium]NIU12041.1 aldo/keto reductase [Phycisphaerae bacterium]NIU59896.1 aldo/keto reductase [Phycisphaerae bacterium]
MKRRTFLKTVGSIATGSALGVQAVLGGCEQPTSTDKIEKVAGLPRRVLGRTGREVSIVGFPGLALVHYEQERCNDGIHDAFKRGVNYFDVAPAYGNGDAEIKMGIGLQGIDRSRIFLACKTNKRDKEGARMELERSLKRLKTDYFDLYQLHHLRRPDEVKQALGPKGAMETILKAKEQGKIKYLGFSAHTTKGAIEAMKGFRFDTVMFPINFVEFFTMDFGKPVLELANKQGAAVLAIKPMSTGRWPKDAKKTRKWWYRTTETQEEVNLAMRFTLSKKPVVAGIPPSFLDLLDKAIEAGRSYKPINKTETKKLRKMAKTCESVFRREEEQVAHGGSINKPVYPDSPHERCSCAYV